MKDKDRNQYLKRMENTSEIKKFLKRMFSYERYFEMSIIVDELYKENSKL